jgi:energy-coupling factor transporter ATP-binding protein EcfA2
VVSAPVQTRVQRLPFRELQWQDFERLCLRLARRDTDPEDCRFYGTQGDDQQGIDLLGRVRGSDERYVYQCKREKKFGPANIRAAVDRFLTGRWRAEATSLYLCTSDDLRNRQRIDEIDTQRTSLKQQGIRFVAWDAEELDEQLRAHPDLIDDFFGRAWVRAFLGNEAADRLGQRLDALQVADFRARFARLYLNIFRQHDPSFTFRTQDSPTALSYVLPDVIAEEPLTRDSDRTSSVRKSPDFDDWLYPYDISERTVKLEEPDTEPVERRSHADAWIVEGDMSLVVGGPGSGKSTLLRMVTLDLLSPDPQLAPVARRWGRFLPVWIPFARWTELREKRATDVSLRAFLEDWLKLWDESDLFALVDAALKDERLVLLVDGLDECSNSQSAASTLDLLAVFIRQRGVPIVATSRIRTYTLGLLSGDWRKAVLAPLSEEQQLRIALSVLGADRSGETSEDHPATASQAREFLRHVRRTAELRGLARTPLLLTVLVHLWRDCSLR